MSSWKENIMYNITYLGSVQVSVHQKFILRIEARFTDETIAALYILPFKVTKNVKLSLFQFKLIKPLHPVLSQH